MNAYYRLIATILMWLAISAVSVAAESNPYGGMTLAQFIQHVGRQLDLTIVISDRVRANKPITIYVDHALSDKKLYETLRTILRLHDFIAIEHDGIVRIVRDRKARSSPVPVIGSEE